MLLSHTSAPSRASLPHPGFLEELAADPGLCLQSLPEQPCFLPNIPHPLPNPDSQGAFSPPPTPLSAELIPGKGQQGTVLILFAQTIALVWLGWGKGSLPR